MVEGDRNLFVRKGGASQKRLGNTAPVHTFISCMGQLVPQELDDKRIHVLDARKFCRSTSEVGVLEQSRYSASIERMLVYIRYV